MRGASVNFKKVTSAIHSVSHANRDVPPAYLLPDEHSHGTHVVIDDAGEVQRTLTHKMSLASGRAKASKDYSPIWEGVINLPEPSKDITPKQQIEIVKAWCVEYEKLTGHKVLRADVHLDEGYVDSDGQPKFNAHAHVFCDRTNDKGRVIKLAPAQLRAVQTMTSEVTNLERGIDARQTRRKHINHHNFKFDAEKNRIGLDKEKAKTEFEGRLTDTLSRNLKDTKEKLKEAQQEATQQAQELAQLKEQYRLDREALKASGTAKQADYQALKNEHEAAMAKLASTEAELTKTKEKEVTLTAENTTLKAENAKLQTELDAKNEADRVRFASVADNYQADLAAGVPAHLIAPRTDPLPSHPTNPAQPVAPATTPKSSKTASEATKHKTHPIPSPTPEKPPEAVFPRLTEAEFKELPKQKLSDRVVEAAKDVLVWGVGLVEAARKQQIFQGNVSRAIEKLLGNYKAPEPPAPPIEPVKKAPAPAKASPGRSGGLSR